MTKRITNTDKVELVETHNLYLALRRLNNITPYSAFAWRRALYHALAMEMGNSETVGKIRQALELP